MKTRKDFLRVHQNGTGKETRYFLEIPESQFLLFQHHKKKENLNNSKNLGYSVFKEVF